MDSGRRRLLAILALFVVPWSFVDAGGRVTIVFPFGFVNFAPLSLEDIVSFVTVDTIGLPQFLLAWPVGVGIYLLAVASAVSGVVLGREDRRVTALLLVLVGLTQLRMAIGFSGRIGTYAVPVVTVCALALVWWFDWPVLRRSLPAQD
jgi:uncharacterized protein (TIGR04206 family)